MLLCREMDAAQRVQTALEKALLEERTVDLGGSASTDKFVKAILRHM